MLRSTNGTKGYYRGYHMGNWEVLGVLKGTLGAMVSMPGSSCTSLCLSQRISAYMSALCARSMRARALARTRMRAQREPGVPAAFTTVLSHSGNKRTNKPALYAFGTTDDAYTRRHEARGSGCGEPMRRHRLLQAFRLHERARVPSVRFSACLATNLYMRRCSGTTVRMPCSGAHACSYPRTDRGAHIRSHAFTDALIAGRLALTPRV